MGSRDGQWWQWWQEWSVVAAVAGMVSGGSVKAWQMHCCAGIQEDQKNQRA